MKKKLALGLTGIMVLSALTGCGQASSKYLLDVDYSDYVKLCEYTGLNAEKVTVDVTDEEIQEQIESNMYDFVTYDPVTDRGIEVGDCANIDYTATIDGQESEDYSGESEDVFVGEGYLYPELEDALVGMKTDESKQVEVVLTEDYAIEGDVGKTLSVDVTVNEITIENLPEYNEEFVKENTDYDTIEAYEASVKEELLAYKEESYKYDAIDTMMSYIIDNSEFDGYPDELYTQCEENYDGSNEYYAAMYGMELDDYLELMGIDEDTKKEEITENVNYELVVGAIAQKEKFDCTEDEINEFVSANYADYGYESEDEFLEDYSEEEVGYEIIYEKVIDFLYENAEFTEISEEEYLEEHAEEYYDEDFDEESEDSEASEDTDVEDAGQVSLDGILEDIQNEEESADSSETSEEDGTDNAEQSDTSEESTVEE